MTFAGIPGKKLFTAHPRTNAGPRVVHGMEIGIDPMTYGSDASLDAILAIPEPDAALLIAGLCGLGAVIRRFRR